MTLRVLRRNAKIAWHCPEIRGHIARLYGWKWLAILARGPVLVVAVPAALLSLAGDALTAAGRSLWDVTGAVFERRKMSEVDAAHDILPIEEIRSRLGEPKLRSGNEILAEIVAEHNDGWGE